MQRTVVLVQRAKAGDAEAMNELFVRYGPKVLRKVRAKLNGELRRKTDSQEIQQKVMFSAFRALPTFEMLDEEAFEKLLEEIVTNQINDEYDYWHRQKRDMDREQRELDADGPGGSPPPELPDDATRTPTEILRERERQAAVRECMDRLKEAHRELVRMRNFEGMSWEAIGATLGIEPDAARQRHATARVHLARLLEERGLGPDEGLTRTDD
jgi:RNA polymerase sigma-70 factor (ECF subfamily)